MSAVLSAVEIKQLDATKKPAPVGEVSVKIPWADSIALAREVGYKIVDANLRGYGGFQFRVGEHSSVSGALQVCANGLHYCLEPIQCMRYAQPYKRPLRYLRVVAMGEAVADVSEDGTVEKKAARYLYIDGELSGAEWAALILPKINEAKSLTRALFAADTNNVALLSTYKSADADWILYFAAAAKSINAVREVIRSVWGHNVQEALDMCFYANNIEAATLLLDAARHVGHVLNCNYMLGVAAQSRSVEVINLLMSRDEMKYQVRINLKYALPISIDLGSVHMVECITKAMLDSGQQLEILIILNGCGLSDRDPILTPLHVALFGFANTPAPSELKASQSKLKTE